MRQLLATVSYGEPIFDSNLNLLPFVDGISMGYVLNVICFMPLGFLSPLVSRTYDKAGKSFLLGAGTSLLIEISQMFTRYRATDIDDLTANVLGAMAGWLCLKLFMKSRTMRRLAGREKTVGSGCSCSAGWYLPVVTAGIAFLVTFFV